MSHRVLFVASWYPSSQESVDGVFIREHARAAALHHDVAVLHLAAEDATLEGNYSLQRERDDRTGTALATWHTRYRRSLPGSRPLHRWFNAVRAAGDIAAEGFHPDLVHANVHDTAIPALLIARKFGIPAVLSEHSSAFPRQLLTPGQKRRARFSLPRMHTVMPVSTNLRDAMSAMGIDARYRVVPNTFDPAVFYPPPVPSSDGVLRLLFVGMMTPVKGLAVLVTALSALRDSQWTLDLVGDGPDRSTIERAFTEAGIQDRVTFHGLRHKEEVAAHMRAADVLVLPSLWENLPCVAIEAMACGLPVIASDVGGVPELVDATTGTLVPAGDSTALADALRDHISGRTRFDRARITAEAVRHYSLDEVGAAFTEIYDDAVGSHR